MYELDIRTPLLFTFLIIVLISLLIRFYLGKRKSNEHQKLIDRFKGKNPKSLKFSQIPCDVKVKFPTILSGYYLGKYPNCNIYLNKNQILICPYSDSLLGKNYSPPYILGENTNSPLIPSYFVNKIEKVDEFLRLSFEREHNTKVQLDLALTDEQFKELNLVLSGKET